MLRRTLPLALVISSFCSACHGALWGNLMMLALTVGIFMGTLSLGNGD